MNHCASQLAVEAAAPGLTGDESDDVHKVGLQGACGLLLGPVSLLFAYIGRDLPRPIVEAVTPATRRDEPVLPLLASNARPFPLPRLPLPSSLSAVSSLLFHSFLTRRRLPLWETRFLAFADEPGVSSSRCGWTVSPPSQRQYRSSRPPAMTAHTGGGSWSVPMLLALRLWSFNLL